ncbi:hypothetical protein A7982_12417 [Minicystis rosea]|nr:hypothetical protein A7982_12417 [Minicystis rosea]
MPLTARSTGPWLDRYDDPLPIRSRGSFHLVSASRRATGRRCVVVVPGPGADVPRVEDALAEIERVHGLLDHPRIPRVIERGRAGEVPFLELGSDAIVDGAEVVRIIADAEQKIPYAQADGFIAGARLALQAAHAVTDPRTGGPVCIGRISYANFLFAENGRWSLVGFGHNFPITRDTGAPDGWVASFHAPEMSTGGTATPMGDYVAILLIMRSLLPFADTAGTLGRILRGEFVPRDRELFEHLRWFDQHVMGQLPQLRPPIEEAVAVSDRIRALLGVTVDGDGFDGFVASLLERQEEPRRLEDSVPPGGQAVILGRDAAFIVAPDGRRHELGRAQRRIMKALVERHLRDPAATFSMWEVLEAGWPGERPIFEAGANRVYVTLARLRRLGLRDVIERSDEGYRISPRVTVRWAD